MIGLSGGIDSTLVAVIAADALGAEHVHGVLDAVALLVRPLRSDAEALAANLGIDYRTISIEPAFAAYLEHARRRASRTVPPDLTEENLQSRIRGQVLMALSNKFGWMVLTTGNKSEMAVGYSTLYGDSVGGFAVHQGRAQDRWSTTCAATCNDTRRAGDHPEACSTKPPSAELRPDQRDDQSLPAYEVLDPILEAYVEEDRTAGEIVGHGYDEAIVRRVDAPGRPRRVQAAPDPAGRPRHDQGVRQGPPPADHQRLPGVVRERRHGSAQACQ